MSNISTENDKIIKSSNSDGKKLVDKKKLTHKNKYIHNDVDLVKTKGSGCSKSGNKYERRVYDIISNTLIDGKKFNTLRPDQLGGSKTTIDITCNYKKENDIGI